MRIAPPRTATQFVALAVAATVALAIAGCTPEASVPKESAAASAPPTASSTPVAEEEEPGSLALPKSFPDDEIPLIDGTVVVSNDLSGGYVVWITSVDLANDFAAASEVLIAAGFDNTVSTSDDATFFGAFAGEKWQIQLSAGDDPTYGPVVAYTIYPTA
jgi:hypothetical protein